MDAKRIINGTWGEVWLDGEFVGECYGLQAKVNFTKEDVSQCGQMGLDKKIMGYEGTGSLKLFKVNTRLGKKMADNAREGRDVRCEIISKLADPDSYGKERIAIRGVSFDDLTLADWEAKTAGKIEAPFHFVDYEYYDAI